MDAGLDTTGIMVWFLLFFRLGVFAETLTRFVILGAWKSFNHTICPANVVDGVGSSLVGTCARTWSTSSNKLISYVCDQSLYSYNYICQKAKQRAQEHTHQSTPRTEIGIITTTSGTSKDGECLTDQECNTDLVTSRECKQGFKNMTAECECLPELWCRDGSTPIQLCPLLCYPKKVVGCEHWGADCQICKQAKNVNPCIYKDIVGICQENGKYISRPEMPHKH